MPRLQRIEILVFIVCFFAYAYFHQGGGWNQNARFAEVRAMVEEGRFAIDNYLVYERVPGSPVFRRNSLMEGEYLRGGQHFRLSWVDMDWHLFPINGREPSPEVEKSPMIEVCASGDVAYVASTGHFHPNKPPGTSFVGYPAYWVLFHLERAVGLSPDHWWILTLNAWLTTVCSVGVCSALAAVLFFRLAVSFGEGANLRGGPTVPALLATLSWAFGTTFFPMATLFFDHALTASLLVAGFYFLRCGNTGRTAYFAGVCAGMSAVTNYVAAIAVIFLGLYVLLARKGAWRTALIYSLGVLGPFLLICAYDWINFGSPFRINNDFQNPLFKEAGGAWLGMFPIPRSVGDLARLNYVAMLLLFSPFRGLFFFAPVLVLGVVGLVSCLRQKILIPEVRLCAAVFGFFFLVNVAFNGYHGGYSAGPRYLVPGIPFLALGLVPAFAQWRKLGLGLMWVSISVQFLLTVTDAQNPTGVGGHVRIEGRREEWGYNLVSEYAWPLFWEGRAWPLLNEQIEFHMEKEQARIDGETEDLAERKVRGNQLREELRDSIVRANPSPFLLASIQGPVSVNPLGAYEGLFTYGVFPPDSTECRFASFNVGEFIFPQSRWSLLPLGLVSFCLLGLAFAWARSESSPLGVSPKPASAEI